MDAVEAHQKAFSNRKTHFDQGLKNFVDQIEDTIQKAVNDGIMIARVECYQNDVDLGLVKKVSEIYEKKSYNVSLEEKHDYYVLILDFSHPELAAVKNLAQDTSKKAEQKVREAGSAVNDIAKELGLPPIDKATVSALGGTALKLFINSQKKPKR